jgi:hypothetical protein
MPDLRFFLPSPSRQKRSIPFAFSETFSPDPPQIELDPSLFDYSISRVSFDVVSKIFGSLGRHACNWCRVQVYGLPRRVSKPSRFYASAPYPRLKAPFYSIGDDFWTTADGVRPTISSLGKLLDSGLRTVIWAGVGAFISSRRLPISWWQVLFWRLIGQGLYLQLVCPGFFHQHFPIQYSILSGFGWKWKKNF